jgi:spermidine/putrescine ABC transporter ATP-binding subunit
MMSSVELRQVTMSYDHNIMAVRTLNLKVDEGEFIVLLGPSGCGKTTTLRMIAGFIQPTEGHILIGGDDVTNVPPRLRQIGMVFQNYALFPNMTVAENIAFGMEQRNIDRVTINKRVDEMLSLARLNERHNHYPAELSGGQQQRVALARALAFSPRILLMDEPMGALDLKLREAMQIELRRMQRMFNITTILVTHDQQEAMSLADRIVIMDGGCIQQVGAPDALYHRPASQFVAEFIGKNNVLRGRITQVNDTKHAISLAEGISIKLDLAGRRNVGETLVFGVRPEKIEITPRGGSTRANVVSGVVEQRRFLGNRVDYVVRLPWQQMIRVEQSTGNAQYEPDVLVDVGWNMADIVPLNE